MAQADGALTCQTRQGRARHGSALLLPAFWYHQVESFAAPGTLNVAVNHWFDGAPDEGGASPAAMHRILRAKLRVNCL